MGDSVKSLFLSRIYENAVTTSMLLPKIWICCVKVAMHRKHKTDGPAIQSMGVWGTVWFWIKLYIGLMRSWDAAFQNFPEKLNHTFHGLKHSGIWYSVSHKGRVWQGEKRHLSKPKTFVRFTAILFLHQSVSLLKGETGCLEKSFPMNPWWWADSDSASYWVIQATSLSIIQTVRTWIRLWRTAFIHRKPLQQFVAVDTMDIEIHISVSCCLFLILKGYGKCF